MRLIMRGIRILIISFLPNMGIIMGAGIAQPRIKVGLPRAGLSR